jgi:hypothetical protein
MTVMGEPNPVPLAFYMQLSNLRLIDIHLAAKRPVSCALLGEVHHGISEALGSPGQQSPAFPVRLTGGLAGGWAPPGPQLSTGGGPARIDRRERFRHRTCLVE